MNNAQRNIISIMMSYGDWSWYQNNDWGTSIDIDPDESIEYNFEEVSRYVRSFSRVLVYRNEKDSNVYESFCFECSYPTDHFHSNSWYFWHDTKRGEKVPFVEGEVAEVARMFASAFELPIHYEYEEDSK